MQEPNLEQVKRLAEQLSPEERKDLFQHLAAIPDSGIHSGSLTDPPYEIWLNAKQQEDFGSTDRFVIFSSPPGMNPTGVAVTLKGKTVFQVFYYPENLRGGGLKIRSWQDAPPADELKSEIRGELAKAGIERTEEEIIEACKKATRQIYEAVNEGITNQVSARLPDMTGLLVDATLKIIEINMENSFARHAGKQGKKLEEIEKILEPYWQHIKEKQLGVTAGGARNVKHVWTEEQRDCLASNYERLQPIWAEAKRIAVAARKSKETTRSRRWQEEVKGAYPDLPDEFIERLSAPRSADAKPSDIALAHAASLCIPVSYSLRRLRDELKKLRSRQFNTPI